MDLGTFITALQSLNTVAPQLEPSQHARSDLNQKDLEATQNANQVFNAIPAVKAHPALWNIVQQLILGTGRDQMGIQQQPNSLGSLITGGK